MNRIVAVAFKSVAFAIIFVMALSLIFYLYRAYTLNQRMEIILDSMQQDVAKHNYLTEDAKDMYVNMLKNLSKDMNSGGDVFIKGFNMNYAGLDSGNLLASSVDSDFATLGSSSVHYCGGTAHPLNQPAGYGDIMVIRVEVKFNAISWFDDGVSDGSANQFNVRNDVSNSFTYTYQVPCLRYISVTE